MASDQTNPTVAAFRKAFCAEVKRLRETKGWTAEQMAMALGLPAERYRKYESRSPLPHDVIPRFAQICGVSIEALFQPPIKETVTQGKRRKAAA